MPKDNHVIVTKRRYRGLKSLLILVIVSIAFSVFFWEDYATTREALCVIIAYFLIYGLFITNSQSKSIYLKYEYFFAVVIKSMVVNILFTILLFAVLDNKCMGEIVLKMFVLSVINVLSIVVVFKAINWYTGIKCHNAHNVLHLYAEEFTGRNNLEKTMEEIEGRIKDYEYIYLHNFSASVRNRTINLCFDKKKTVMYTACISDVLLRASGLAQDEDVPVYYCSNFDVGGMSASLKRVFDLFTAVLALILLSPVFFIVAVCIKIEDGGSVIYKQVRCTIDLKEFYIYKFRSMTEDSEGDEAKLAEKNDKRLTKVGAFIRKYKIDEIPQLINIIKGDMSIVGPRPERPELIKKAIEKTPEFVLRTKVKAGLTGYAQVRSKYDTKFRDKLLWDLMYIENFSFMLDLKIIIMTVFTIFSGCKTEK